jgi:hypothetical protein
LSRVTSFGRPLPTVPWRRAWRPRSGRTGFEAFPTRVAALTALAALLVGNALIVYHVTTHDADPSFAGLRQSRDENAARSLSDVGEVLQDIRASIEARINRIERIPIERSARQERPPDTADQARRSSESSASSGPAPSAISPGSSSSTSSGSSSDSTAESSSSGGTSAGTGSSDSGGGSQDATTSVGTAGGGGGGGGGSGGSEAGDDGVTGGGGGGGGG